jgi:glycosyltransferase involved in cell wall biosynthesis
MILGGAQENTLLTCRGLAERGHEVLLLSGPTRGPEGELLGEAQRMGVKVEEVPALVRPVSPWKDWSTYCHLRARLRELAPQVVHTHSSKAGVLGRPAARAAGVRAVIHTVHGLPFHRYASAFLNQIYIWAERRAARSCDKIISVAEAMTRQAVSAGLAAPDKFVTVYSGMEIEPFVAARSRRDEVRRRLGYTPEHFVITKLARLFEFKGHRYVLDAARTLVAKHPRARFLFVGDGMLRAKLQERARRLGLTEHLRFAGLVPGAEVPGYLAASDLLVHASLREGLPRAVPQALLAGTPVVAFDLDGAPEVITHEETGLLVPPCDPAALAAAIARMIEEPDLAARTAAAGGDLAARVFPAEKMVEAVASVYEGVLAQRV